MNATGTLLPTTPHHINTTTATKTRGAGVPTTVEKVNTTALPPPPPSEENQPPKQNIAASSVAPTSVLKTLPTTTNRSGSLDSTETEATGATMVKDRGNKFSMASTISTNPSMIEYEEEVY
jgi:hypothetical protein